MPLISVIIPCFNAAATLGATLEALRAQTLQDWEALIVDDGSTDESAEIAKHVAAKDPRIALTRNPGRGPSAARNHAGLNLAKGRILAFCDADDIWTPGKLEAVSKALDAGHADAVFGQTAFFAAHPSDARSISGVSQGDITIETLLGENPVCTLSNLSLGAEHFRALGGFDATLVHNEDLDFLIRLVGHGGQLRGLPGVHVYYRTSPSGLSADLAAMQAARRRLLATAARFGVTANRRNEAIYLRYLARRALRLDLSPVLSARLALTGFVTDPGGFLSPVHRGLATLGAACAAPILPGATRRALFSK
ncbi:glycosyltransferase family 2 protein [Litorisediminicola beolgyonensis]|uniref:Glycosyltransferase family 2 protein n=1 Tax=Litorisediminicola beolgyonensis TaxID=1173614 RepID=A0ABW3ZD86_9RHOB